MKTDHELAALPEQLRETRIYAAFSAPNLAQAAELPPPGQRANCTEPRPLTARQREVLVFVDLVSRRGRPPTLREIGVQFGIRSTNGVNDHLRALERKGYIGREDMKSRSIWITVLGRHELAGSTLSLRCNVCGRGP